MPSTNRDEVRLTPFSGDSQNGRSNDYFKGQQPSPSLFSLSSSWATLQPALALFAVFVIARTLLRRVSLWVVNSARARPSRLTLAHTAESAGARVRFAPGTKSGKQSQSETDSKSQPIRGMDEKSDSNGLVRGKTTQNSLDATGSPRLSSQHTASVNMKGPLHIDTVRNMGSEHNGAKRFMSRPPPAPPLTPPELSTNVFAYEGHRRERSHDSFIHQPNPDYISSATTTMTQSSSSSPSTPKRRSYTKTLPISIPPPQRSPTTTSISVSDPDAAAATPMFSPSSYPPSSPQLPPAPPSLQDSEASYEKGQRNQIDVQGEIISMLDGNGAGWSRHTRVYGGGVCLACAASGGDHGGGFYGATVSPEEMR